MLEINAYEDALEAAHKEAESALSVLWASKTLSEIRRNKQRCDRALQEYGALLANLVIKAPLPGR